MANFVVFVHDAGVPAPGLTDDPEITIRRVDTGAAVVSAAAMTDIGDGWYKYDYGAFDDSLEYVHWVDADPSTTGQVDATSRYYYGNKEVAQAYTAARGALLDNLDYPISSIPDAIWCDTTNGSPGTTPGVNGIPGNPVNTWADTLTLLAATGLRRVHLRGSVALSADFQGYEVFGAGAVNSVVGLGGFNAGGSKFTECYLLGDAGSNTTHISANSCLLSSLTDILLAATDCTMFGTITLAAGVQYFSDCRSSVSGSGTTVLDLQGNDADLSIRSYSGGLTFRNISNAGSDNTAEFVAGQAIIEASCTAGTLNVRGIVAPVTDNSAGTTVDTSAVLPGEDFANLANLDQAISLLDNFIYVSEYGTAGTTPNVNGTAGNPVNNWADALALLAATGCDKVSLHGPITLTSDLAGGVCREVVGDGNIFETIIDINGYDVGDVNFSRVTLNGDMASPAEHVTIQDGRLLDLENALVYADNCLLQGTISFRSSTQYLVHCDSAEPGSGATPILDLQGNATPMNLRGYSGGVEFRNVSDPASLITAEFIAGQVIVDVSCTDGEIVIRGVVAPVTDNSAGTTVNTDGIVPGVLATSTEVAAVAAAIVLLTASQDLTNAQKEAEHITEQSATPMTTPGTVVVRNTTTLERWEADAWEDEAGTIGYRGAGLEKVGMLVSVAYS